MIDALFRALWSHRDWYFFQMNQLLKVLKLPTDFPFQWGPLWLSFKVKRHWLFRRWHRVALKRAEASWMWGEKSADCFLVWSDESHVPVLSPVQSHNKSAFALIVLFNWSIWHAFTQKNSILSLLCGISPIDLPSIGETLWLLEF